MLVASNLCPCRTPHRYEPLRLFLLVLLWPGLMEPEYHNTIFKKLCSGMNCLSAEQRDTLQQWLQEVTASHELVHINVSTITTLC